MGVKGGGPLGSWLGRARQALSGPRSTRKQVLPFTPGPTCTWSPHYRQNPLATRQWAKATGPGEGSEAKHCAPPGGALRAPATPTLPAALGCPTLWGLTAGRPPDKEEAAALPLQPRAAHSPSPIAPCHGGKKALSKFHLSPRFTQGAGHTGTDQRPDKLTPVTGLVCSFLVGCCGRSPPPSPGALA